MSLINLLSLSSSEMANNKYIGKIDIIVVKKLSTVQLF